MLVKEYMTRHPPMVEPTMSIVEAQRYMGENHVRHLPVVGDGKRLLGLVTRQTLMVDPGRLGSLDVWEITRQLSGMRVADVMVKAEHVICIAPDTPVEEAARIMVERKVGCLPVLDGGAVVGIITEMDLLCLLMEMMATREHGVRVTIRMPNVRGELARLVSAIAAQGWGIPACGGLINPKNPQQWDAVVKIHDANREEVVAALSRIEGQQIVDVREV